MIQKLNSPVSVGVSFDHSKKVIFPRWVLWNGRMHSITKVGLHHTFRTGRTLFHVFSVSGKTLFFRLVLDTDTLGWRLSEVSDGLPD